jgi:hypothetical protein
MIRQLGSHRGHTTIRHEGYLFDLLVMCPNELDVTYQSFKILSEVLAVAFSCSSAEKLLSNLRPISSTSGLTADRRGE